MPMCAFGRLRPSGPTLVRRRVQSAEIGQKRTLSAPVDAGILFGSVVIATKWMNQEVPNVNGLVLAHGELCEVGLIGSASAYGKWEEGDWLNVGILAQEELYGGRFLVKCGEACEHGSIGVVVLECAQSHRPIWMFVSDVSNPFDEIVFKGSWVLALSSAGAVLRFRFPSENTALSLLDISFFGTT